MLKFRIYFTFSLLIVSISAFAAIDRGRVDSLKTLIASLVNKQTVADSISINRLNQLATNYFESNPDSTLFYAHKAIDLARKTNYKAGIANGLVQTAHANFFKGRSQQAETEFAEAIAIYKDINDLTGLSNAYKLHGRMDNLLARYKSALFYLGMATDINKKLNNGPEIADCYKNLGIVYFSEGQNSTALDYYYKALYITLKSNDKNSSAAIYNDIGVVLQGMEVYPKALEYYRKALNLLQSTNNLNGVGTINENIGEVLIAQKEYDKAIGHLTKAIKIAKKQDDKDGMSSVYTDFGLCYSHKKQFTLAKAYLDSSLQIASKYKIVYNQAYALIGMATMYNMQGDFKNAYVYATQGQQLAGTLRNLTVRSNAALQLNKTLAGLGKYNEAYQMLNRYNELKDSLNNNESIQKLTSYNLALDFASKEKQLAEQHREKDESFRQRIKQQRLINAIFLSIIAGMLTVSIVYYRQKRKQQKINAMLEDKNREVLQQKADLDDQAQKLNNLNVLKDRLISILAHDLRAPLSTLRGLFGLLQDETISHQQMLEMIPSVLKKLEYTSDFLDTLLFWINSQMDNFENSAKNFHIKDIVAYETESYHEQARLKGINLIDNVPKEVVASADPNSVRIVIRNLITNAIKFSRQDDTIEISAAQQDDHNYVISVKDTGMGMSDEQLGKLFKSKVNSNTGTNNESGTGMGMLFCKDLVEKCSGKIWVTSKQGQGTKFSFTLPMGALSEQHLAVA
ncbi:tetratricopeptide repeat protein [Mucilaginibacter sp. L3T2-6]|uniref:tetratricopeptide repeat-containing sensor histidine kinase n=1 Tax=Mucilaginibacter sp. L3T2-6 TaxID=3062491 RepID=UPI002674CCD7|nr:tetratricopeptide repeat protein [Mucilaginibacter sp. L3T2-6]MDO3644651.1 tetratricopeptide repeat protein [Mucilaginibacter sp. L3T2-6]MDV6217103.1 tetratricopeptide repeat protein [Mucilaginibacter sp. L3T2-6]